MYPKYTILSESAVCVTFGDKPEIPVWQEVHRLNACLQQQPFCGFLATVPAFLTLTVHFDPFAVFHSHSEPNIPAMVVLEHLKTLQAGPGPLQSLSENLIEIPVCYGGKFGPDLPEVAERLQLSERDIIQLHSQTLFRVWMIGFSPGFPYMGFLPAALELPRKKTISPKVAAGSVAIAGNMTCIYPNESPAGWYVIGQTPLLLFDPEASNPCLLNVGMQVSFVPQKT